MTAHIKQLVSKKKRRFVEDGFNLDLTYISDRVIAMGFPSSHVEALYRNSMEDVKRMLEQKHKDHYKIYNLCSERSYDISKFHSRVSVYPFDDHNPPEFSMMKPFCEDVDRWLNEDERNVAVVHCKAGKGRTGLMICAYLLHCRHSLTAEEVLSYYGTSRTMDQKGVTIPSQKRYVDYYSALVTENLQYNDVKLYLYSFVIDPLPHLGLGQQEGYIQFEIRQTRVAPYNSEVYLVKRTDGRINIVLPSPLLLVGDVKIEFTQKIKIFDVFNRPRFINQHKLFHFWVNTFFIDLERSTPLTHESISSRPNGPKKVSTAAPAAISGAVAAEAAAADRNCRSTHNSGGGLSDGLHFPPPRQLRANLSSSGAETRCVEPLPVVEQQEEDLHSPNGSCLASVQTIHSHPPARTVCIVEPEKEERGGETARSPEQGLKLMSISDDTLTEQGALDTTQCSFNKKRTRHSSVPMSSKMGQQSGGLVRPTRQIPGNLMSVRLKKNQIDKADKSNKFSDNFNVTLFLVRPNDQTLQEEFTRSNQTCQPTDTGADCSWRPDCDSSEEEEGAESDIVEGLPSSSVSATAPGSPPLHGMVRNKTAPAKPLAHLTSVSQSTWI